MAKQQERNQSWRYSVLFLIALFMTIVIIVRLIQIQIIERKGYALIGEKQYKYELGLPAKRGKIFDREHRSLALNTPSVSVGVHPKLVINKSRVAQQLAPVLNRDSSYLRSLLMKNSPFVWLARGLPSNLGDKIKNLHIGGVQICNDITRCYPYAQLAAHLMGFTDVDGNGISGIEFSYDHVLRGKAGEVVLQLTANGRSFERVEYPVLDPKNGYHVVLTIDQAYQTIVEEELKMAVEKSGALGGVVIVTDPYTGEILSMATEPSFDPGHAGKYHPSTWRLRPVTDQMEPGSTFKIAMMSAVIEEEIKKPQDIVFCEHGKYEVIGETIHDSKKYGWLTMHDVVVHSSNIGMAKTMMEVPHETIYSYARAFGFGMKTGIDLEGETAGVLKLPTEWSGFTPAAMAIGHEIAATPLQLINMFAVMANGGLLIKPIIVKEILDSSGEIISKSEPEVVRRVLSQSTVQTITAMMEDVVKRGTGKLAAIDGLRVCGKTGTTRKIKPGGRGYIINQHLASFGGFFPAEGRAKRCIFIVIDTPTQKIYGGDVAAPCFKKIAQRIIGIEGMDKFVSGGVPRNANVVSIPSLIGRELRIVRQMLGKLELRMQTAGEGQVVAVQNPLPGSFVPKGSEVVVELIRLEKEKGVERIIPDVLGLPLREALNMLNVQGIDVVVNGSGKVVKQQPVGGTRITGDEQCLLECESTIDLIELLTL